MHARLGHADRLEELFKEVGGRAVTGPATEALAGAKEGLWQMRHNPGVAYLRGPMALKNLLLAQGAEAKRVAFLDAYRSPQGGVTLAEAARVAGEAAGVNLYSYVLNNPLRYIDPNGLVTMECLPGGKCYPKEMPPTDRTPPKYPPGSPAKPGEKPKGGECKNQPTI